MSGESSSASPGLSAAVGTSWIERPSPRLGRPAPPVVRASPGRIRSSSNQRTSSGWQASTGRRVVGRSTPAGLTTAPIRLFTSVDLPAPGRAADDHQHRRLHLPQAREQVVVDLGDEVVADAARLRGAGHVELQAERRAGRRAAG